MFDWTRIEVDFFNGECHQHYALNRADLVGNERKDINVLVAAMKNLYHRRPPQELRAKNGESTYRFRVATFDVIELFYPVEKMAAFIRDEVIELFCPAEKMPPVTYSLAAFIMDKCLPAV